MKGPQNFLARLIFKIVKRTKGWFETYRLKAYRVQVKKIVRGTAAPDFSKSELFFRELQSRYSERPEYGYGTNSIYKRACNRVVNLIDQDDFAEPRLKGLDLGAGDGMLGLLLQVFGHQMMLCDIEDWRVNAAKQLPMITVDHYGIIPASDETFDFVVSFNSFEHFSNPERMMDELLRVTKPGGIFFFEFGPLYCSPWGLHAYRSLRMPYPQFLFSENFVEQKLDEIGIWDLGNKRNKLQYLNKWSSEQFENLWKQPNIEVVSLDWHIDRMHLDLICEYPECFRGRGLSLDDLERSGVTVKLRRC